MNPIPTVKPTKSSMLVTARFSLQPFHGEACDPEPIRRQSAKYCTPHAPPHLKGIYPRHFFLHFLHSFFCHKLLLEITIQYFLIYISLKKTFMWAEDEQGACGHPGRCGRVDRRCWFQARPAMQGSQGCCPPIVCVEYVDCRLSFCRTGENCTMHGTLHFMHFHPFLGGIMVYKTYQSLSKFNVFLGLFSGGHLCFLTTPIWMLGSCLAYNRLGLKNLQYVSYGISYIDSASRFASLIWTPEVHKTAQFMRSIFFTLVGSGLFFLYWHHFSPYKQISDIFDVFFKLNPPLLINHLPLHKHHPLACGRHRIWTRRWRRADHVPVPLRRGGRGARTSLFFSFIFFTVYSNFLQTTHFSESILIRS